MLNGLKNELILNFKKLRSKLNQLQPIFIACVLNEVYLQDGVREKIAEVLFFMLLPISNSKFWIRLQKRHTFFWV